MQELAKPLPRGGGTRGRVAAAGKLRRDLEDLAREMELEATVRAAACATAASCVARFRRLPSACGGPRTLGWRCRARSLWLPLLPDCHRRGPTSCMELLRGSGQGDSPATGGLQ